MLTMFDSFRITSKIPVCCTIRLDDVGVDEGNTDDVDDEDNETF